MAYYWAPQMNSQMTMRFLLPTFPLYVIGGAWLLAEALRQAPVAARVAVPLAVVTLQLCWGTSTLLDETTQGTYQRQLLATVSEALQKHVPAGSVVLADEHTLQDLDFVRIWKTADMSVAGVGGGGFGGNGGNNNRRNNGGNNRNRNRGGGGFAGGNGDNNTPSPRQEEKSEVAQSKYTGTTEQREAKFEKDIRAWGGGNKVYFVGTRDEMEQTFGQMADLGHDVVVIADHLPLPPEPAEAPREGLMGMPGGGPGGPGGPGGGPGGLAGAIVQQAMRRRGGGGGMFGSALAGEKEFVIAEWTVPNRQDGQGLRQ
jgi:hypothetical protein